VKERERERERERETDTTYLLGTGPCLLLSRSSIVLPLVVVPVLELVVPLECFELSQQLDNKYQKLNNQQKFSGQLEHQHHHQNQSQQ